MAALSGAFHPPVVPQCGMRKLWEPVSKVAARCEAIIRTSALSVEALRERRPSRTMPASDPSSIPLKVGGLDGGRHVPPGAVQHLAAQGAVGRPEPQGVRRLPRSGQRLRRAEPGVCVAPHGRRRCGGVIPASPYEDPMVITNLTV